nr:VOC family protein [Mucilaginibacter ginsenosidivorax]
MALNGGPMFKFNEAISLFVDCKDQEEVDYFWEKLSEGGQKSRCGWLKDKFGLSWQIVPDTLSKVLYGADREGSARAMQAMMKMDKLIVKDLQDAYDGK